MASNQSCHFQKISQMNVLNAINIGLTVKPIHGSRIWVNAWFMSVGSV